MAEVQLASITNGLPWATLDGVGAMSFRSSRKSVFALPEFVDNHVLTSLQSVTFSSPSKNNESYRTYDPSGYSDGPIQVGYPDFSTPASFSFIEAIAGVGLAPISYDLNLGNNVGAKQEPLTIDTKMARSSSFSGAYKQAENRTNLEVLTYATVQQILTTGEGDSLQAIGAVVSHESTGEDFVALANKEVILAAGTFQTPQLLMISVRASSPDFKNSH